MYHSPVTSVISSAKTTALILITQLHVMHIKKLIRTLRRCCYKKNFCYKKVGENSPFYLIKSQRKIRELEKAAIQYANCFILCPRIQRNLKATQRELIHKHREYKQEAFRKLLLSSIFYLNLGL